MKTDRVGVGLVSLYPLWGGLGWIRRAESP